ncbi:MAG: class I SAM-dependent methyltransferase [Pseudomonadales bacterium]
MTFSTYIRSVALWLSAAALAVALGTLAATHAASSAAPAWLEVAIAGDHRNAANRARDSYRNPAEVLSFFGLQPDQTVVEIWPATGWWTEILAPVLRERGVYFAAGFSMTANRTPEWRRGMHKAFTDKLAADPQLYDAVVVTELAVPERTTVAPPGSADLVLTFRNVHNWMSGEYAPAMFRVMARALKPGGVLGVVEHRARPGTTLEDMIRSGYVTEARVIELAEQAGLVLEAASEVNANPQDTTDHPAGVWTLPPSLRHCGNLPIGQEQDHCVEHYRAIGESDRMTLKFRKPPGTA